MKPLVARLMPSLGVRKSRLARQEDSGIRRMMSIATLAESLTGTEGTVEARYEAYVWTDSSDGAGADRARAKKENV